MRYFINTNTTAITCSEYNGSDSRVAIVTCLDYTRSTKQSIPLVDVGRVQLIIGRGRQLSLRNWNALTLIKHKCKLLQIFIAT